MAIYCYIAVLRGCCGEMLARSTLNSASSTSEAKAEGPKNILAEHSPKPVTAL